MPVLSPEEAAATAGSAIPLPHPDLSVTRSRAIDSLSATNHVPTLIPGQHSEEILLEMDLGGQFQALFKKGTIVTASAKSKL